MTFVWKGTQPSMVRRYPLPSTLAHVAALLLALLLAAPARAQAPLADAGPDGGPDSSAAFPAIQLTKIAEGLTQPLQVMHAGDGSGRLFMVERYGYVRVWQDGALLDEPFLNLFSVTQSSCPECGLLSIAFPPDFETSRVFYVSFNTKENVAGPENPDDPNPVELVNDSVIARFRVSAGNPNLADPASRQDILRLNQPYANHNGGQITFGPDGKLYVAFGDGGSGGDPLDSGQSKNTLLGKILRLNVGSTGPYTIPADNPFVGEKDAKPEIWVLGLRNPWRWSFDRKTGDLWIGDVGQNQWEEVDFVPAAQAGGQNFGWRAFEGTHCFEPSLCSTTQGITMPVFEYSHGSGTPVGASISGGVVYRGPYAPLDGLYIFGDYVGWIGALRRTSGGMEFGVLLDPPMTTVTFNEDEVGNLYTTDYGRGIVYRIDIRYDAYIPMILSGK